MEGLHLLTNTSSQSRPLLGRAILARHPNGDPEGIPNYVSAANWTPPLTTPCDSGVVHQANLPDNYPGMFQDFLLGSGGACDMYELDDSSYWCQPSGRTHAPTYCARTPSGLVFDPTDFAGVNLTFSRLDAARVVAWRGSGEWFTWAWSVAAYDQDSLNVTLGRGGFQGGEGSNSGGRWLLEGILELLDAPGEYYYDNNTQALYYWPNTTTGTPPPASTALYATNLTEVRRRGERRGSGGTVTTRRIIEERGKRRRNGNTASCHRIIGSRSIGKKKQSGQHCPPIRPGRDADVPVLVLIYTLLFSPISPIVFYSSNA